VGVIQGRSDLVEKVDDFLQGQVAALEHIFECAAVQVAHDDIRRVVAAIEVVNWQNMGVFQASDQPRLTLETHYSHFIAADALADDLDGHIAIDAGLVGAVDSGHPAPSNLFKHVVWTQFAADHPFHIIIRLQARPTAHDLSHVKVEQAYILFPLLRAWNPYAINTYMFKKFRDPVSGLTHFLAAIAAVVGLVLLLIVGRAGFGKQITLLVYGASLILMFSASAAYHLVRARPGVIRNLRKLDHAAIYILIAGTYTPLCFNQFSGFWKWGILAIIWGLALAGIIGKMFIINAPRALTAGIYLLMGWLAMIGLPELLRVLPLGALIWLSLGGVIFTLGAVVYITKTLDFVPGVFGFHESWHIFVILGCLCHFILILFYVAPATAPGL
jgi:hemolysin III